MSDLTEGFPPVANAKTHTLILGSLPSRASVIAHEYYAHPRNAFWTIMGELIAADRGLDYAERTRLLLAAGIGIWDVLSESIRPGSLDASIDAQSAIPNDFDSFLRRHSNIRRLCFNGRAAAQLFKTRVRLSGPIRARSFQLIQLPSTSPAHAAMSVAEKIEHWRCVVPSRDKRHRRTT